jgi:hypothetical protein
MRAVAWLVALSACYSPHLDTCTVLCGDNSPCPDGMQCGMDRHCHAAGDTTVCPAEFWLKVVKSGTGTGYVSSDADIDCGARCTDIELPGPDDCVTLMATASPGSRFVGWTGNCSGTAPCQVIVDSNKTVGAVFDRGNAR